MTVYVCLHKILFVLSICLLSMYHKRNYCRYSTDNWKSAFSRSPSKILFHRTQGSLIPVSTLLEVLAYPWSNRPHAIKPRSKRQEKLPNIYTYKKMLNQIFASRWVCTFERHRVILLFSLHFSCNKSYL